MHFAITLVYSVVSSCQPLFLCTTRAMLGVMRGVHGYVTRMEHLLLPPMGNHTIYPLTGRTVRDDSLRPFPPLTRTTMATTWLPLTLRVY